MLVDTSVWIDFFRGETIRVLEEALAAHIVILSPIVVAELISGTPNPQERRAIEDLVSDLPLHETPWAHWIRVGLLRRRLQNRGLAVSTPDSHIAQCALDRDALLLTRDEVFWKIADSEELRVVREAD